MTKYISKELAKFIKQDAKLIKKHYPELKNADIQNEISRFFGWRHFQELEINITKENYQNFENLNMLRKNSFFNVFQSYLSHLQEKYELFEIDSKIGHIKHKQNIHQYCVKHASLLSDNIEDFSLNMHDSVILINNKQMKNIMVEYFEKHVISEIEYGFEEKEQRECITVIRNLLKGLIDISEEEQPFFLHNVIFEIEDIKKLNQLNDVHQNKNLQKYLDYVNQENVFFSHKKMYIAAFPTVFLRNEILFNPAEKNVVSIEDLLNDNLNVFICIEESEESIVYHNNLEENERIKAFVSKYLFNKDIDFNDVLYNEELFFRH